MHGRVNAVEFSIFSNKERLLTGRHRLDTLHPCITVGIMDARELMAYHSRMTCVHAMQVSHDPRDAGVDRGDAAMWRNNSNMTCEDRQGLQ